MITAIYDTNELNTFATASLKAYAVDLHHLACAKQETSHPQGCNREGLCFTSIQQVKILGEVVWILEARNSPLDEDTLGYIFNPAYCDAPAIAIGVIFDRFLHPIVPAAQ